MFNSLRIGWRLSLGFGLVLALLCLMAGLAAWQVSRLSGSIDNYATNLVPSYESEHHISISLSTLRRWENRHVLLNTAAEMDEVEARMAGERKVLEEALAKYAKLYVSDAEDRRCMEAVQAALSVYFAEWEKIRPVSRGTVDDPAKTAQATRMLLGPSAQAFEAAQAAVARWWDYNVKLAEEEQRASAATVTNARLTLLVLVLTILGLGVTAAIVITRSITQPIQRAVDIATTVAEGDLRSQIQPQGRDETAVLLQALARMNDSLTRIVSQVRASSDSIATGSSQIAMGNADLSQRTEQQASNLQQTAASMEELAGTVKASAQTALHANQMAASAAAAAGRGGELVAGVVATMQEIATASRRIADIIGVIDGIAFQTNILALNAAVEAARAGEQGRGFAVVATEVRSLAGRSAEAAREIKALIGASVEKVETGSRQVDEAGASMGEIVAQVRQVSQLIGEISQAAAEQSTGIAQVGQAVSALDQVTQQNAALVEQSAAAAQSLQMQATALTQAVGAFRLNGEHVAA